MKKFKIILYTLILGNFLSFNTFATFDLEEIIRCTKTGWTAQKAKPQDFDEFSAIHARCRPEGLPSAENLQQWFDNLQTRHASGNSWGIYKLLKTSSSPGEPSITVAYISFGRMPTLAKGYTPRKHRTILETFYDLGIITHTDTENPSFEYGALKRVDERGLAFMVPFFPFDEDSQPTQGLYTQALEFTAFLAARFSNSHRLPLEGTRAHQLIALLDPSNPVVEVAKKAGFCRIDRPGFVKFYPPHYRTMIIVSLTEAAAKETGALVGRLSAQTDAERLLEEAQTKAELLVEEAEAKAERLLEEAKAEAERLLEKASATK